MRRLIFGIIKNVLLLFLVVFFNGCTEDAQELPVKSKDLVITDFVASTPEFSELDKILKKTGLNSLLSVRGPYTVFLPNDEAMKAYYAEKGVGSQDGIDDETWKKFVLNFLVPGELETGDFGLGSVRDRNAIGDYLVTEFDGADVIINKRSKIIKRNILAANGVIHIIDKAIDPIRKSVYEELAGNTAYSIFTAGLEKAGLNDTLHLVEFPFGKKMARTRFTVLAIADTTFNRFKIFNVDDLIARYTDRPEEITSIQNGFYRYMEYHCLGETYYLNNFVTRVYPILSYDNNISFIVDNNYRINLKAGTREFTTFIIQESNIPAKNGAIHTITDLMPVFEPKPSALVWESTDHFDLKQGDYYGKHYARWFDGQNTFANIKWEGDYLLYYWKNFNTGKLLNDDCLSILGWWWIEITTPKIMKGRYKITSNVWSNHVSYAVYVDGVNTAQIKQTDPAETTSWGEFEWTTTASHKIKLVATTPGQLMWDTILFTPIN